MRHLTRSLLTALALLAPFSAARAQLLTADFGGTQATNFICSWPNEYGYCVLNGPLQVGLGRSVLFSAGLMNTTPEGFTAVIGNGVYGLKANGSWDGDGGTYAAVASGLAVRSGLLFRFAVPVLAVGAWVNYADPTTPVALRAYGQSGQLLGEYILQSTAPIETPNRLNAGAFRGIQNLNGIYAFELSGGDVATRDLFISEANVINPPTITEYDWPVEGEQGPTVVTPEPGTYLLVACGLAGLGFLQRRRRLQMAATNR